MPSVIQHSMLVEVLFMQYNNDLQDIYIYIYIHIIYNICQWRRFIVAGTTLFPFSSVMENSLLPDPKAHIQRHRYCLEISVLFTQDASMSL